MLDVAVIIVSWNVRALLADCLQSLLTEFGQHEIKGEIWVVDNGSTDGTVRWLPTAFPSVHLIANAHNPGFGAANNQGMAAAQAAQPHTFFLLNPDTVVRPGALATMLAFLEAQPQVGMVGPRLVYGNGRFQHSAFRFPGLIQLAFDLLPLPPRLYESRWNGRYPQAAFANDAPPFAVDFPLGAAMLVRANVAAATHGFDEAFYMYCEEIDWCRRIQAKGWQIYTLPAAEIVHYSGESTGQIAAQSLLNLWQSRALLYRRHHGWLRQRLARWLVWLGMWRFARQTADPKLQQAYRQVRAIWS